MNGVWIITFVNHPHVWVTNFKSSFMFFKLSVLTSNNVIWMKFSAILFDEKQHIVKTSAAGFMPVCYEIINLFTKFQNFLLMGFICKFKGLYLIVMTCDGLLMFLLDLSDSCIKTTFTMSFKMCFLSSLPLCFREFTVT